MRAIKINNLNINNKLIKIYNNKPKTWNLNVIMKYNRLN